MPDAYVKVMSTTAESLEPRLVVGDNDAPAPAAVVPKSIPLGVTIAVLLVNCAESVNIVFIFPFMSFMISDMGVSNLDLGYYCGGLAASFCTGQFCSSVFWGYLSDRFGRKPTLVLGTLGTAVGTAIFGFSRSYPQAIAGRIVSGLLSGNLGILKTYLTEITDDSNRTKAFAVLQTSGSIGNILGPMIGGLLAKPATKFPATFEYPGSIWAEFPYLLPCIICVVNSCAASLMCHLFLKETRVPGADEGAGAGGGEQGASGVVTRIKSPLHARASDSMDTSVHTRSPPRGQTYAPLDETEHDFCDGEGEAEGGGVAVDVDANDAGGEEDDQSAALQGKRRTSTHAAAPAPAPAPIATTAVVAASAAPVAYPASPFRLCRPSGEGVLTEPVVLLATWNYGLLAFAYIIIDETLPLFMKLETRHGGLGFDSAEIGFVLSLSGAVMLCFNVLVLPRLGGLSKLTLYKVCNFCAIPFTLAWPLAGLANRHMVATGLWRNKSAAMYCLLLLTSSIKNTLAVMTFTAIIILVNHSVPSKDLGKVNGMGQMIAALARAVGPALGGAVWSASVRLDNVFLNFLFAGVFLFVCQLGVYRLPASLDKKRAEADKTGIGGREVEMSELTELAGVAELSSH